MTHLFASFNWTCKIWTCNILKALKTVFRHWLHTVETKTLCPIEHIKAERKVDVLRPVWTGPGCMSTPESTHAYQSKVVEEKNPRSHPFLLKRISTLSIRLHRGQAHDLARLSSTQSKKKITRPRTPSYTTAHLYGRSEKVRPRLSGNKIVRHFIHQLSLPILFEYRG